MTWTLVTSETHWQEIKQKQKQALQETLDGVKIKDLPILVSFDRPGMNWDIIHIMTFRSDEQTSAKLQYLLEEVIDNHALDKVDILAEVLDEELDLWRKPS
jgi:hypothetical protein